MHLIFNPAIFRHHPCETLSLVCSTYYLATLYPTWNGARRVRIKVQCLHLMEESKTDFLISFFMSFASACKVYSGAKIQKTSQKFMRRDLQKGVEEQRRKVGHKSPRNRAAPKNAVNHGSTACVVSLKLMAEWLKSMSEKEDSRFLPEDSCQKDAEWSRPVKTTDVSLSRPPILSSAACQSSS